jgi:SAM-dependent methyltransferase
VSATKKETRNTSGKSKPARSRLPGLAVKTGLIRHPFDLENGVRTSGLVAGRDLKTGHRHQRHATAYYGVAPSVFHSLIDRWRRSRPIAPVEEYTFIDLGAGMGRAMLLAAELPFRQVLGVEFHPTLARIGRRNMAKWRVDDRAVAPMRMYCRDAVEFNLPKGPCVVFLFNPFGETVMKRLLERWRTALKGRERQLDLLYVNNEHDRILRITPGWHRLFYGPIRRSKADLAADRNILHNQPGAEYAATTFEDCAIYRWMGSKLK